MPDFEPRLIEDNSVPMIFFDGLTRVEARAGVMRMIAFVLRLNPETGLSEQVPVALLVRPLEATQEIRAAIKGAACEPYFVDFAN